MPIDFTTGGAPPNLALTNPGAGYPGYTAYTPPAVTPPAGFNIPTLMGLSMATSAFGAASTAVSQSAAIRAQGDYQAGIAKTNAAIAGIQKRQVLEAGDIAASRKNQETRQIVGTQRAAASASGTDVNSGSNALTRIGADFAGKIDEMTIRNNAARAAWGLQTQIIQDDYAGQFAKLTAASQSSQTLLTGGLAAISGPLSIQANYLRFARSQGGGSALPYPNVSTN